MTIATRNFRLGTVPPLGWLLILTTLCLVPFANKAIHIDDTLFVRAAQHIQHHPFDFYGFQMNWVGYSLPMTINFENPPLTSYYLAVVGAVAGWSELVLHLSFLLPALAAAWGTFSLARRFCSRPLLASVLAILSPAFLVSSTTLMCDVLLVAFWTWSLVWFERGLRSGGRTPFVISGLLAGLGYWAKLPAIALVPLLAFWGFAERRKAGWWLIAVGLPLIFVAAYELITIRLYGKGLLLAAAGVASHFQHRGSVWEKEVFGLSFLGGGFLPVLLYMPRLWSLRRLLIGLCVFTPCLLLYPSQGRFALLWGPDGHPNWFLVLQSVAFIASGIHILLMTAADFWDRRDPTALLLTLWVLGIFVFATSLNWTVNCRSLLPVAPAIGILVVRRLDWCDRLASLKTPALAAQLTPMSFESEIQGGGVQRVPATAWRRWLALAPVAVAALLSLFVAKVDYDLAGAGRAAAKALAARYVVSGRTLWFEGHWGFQYYMEQHQARALEEPFQSAVPGDLVVVPLEAPNTFDFSKSMARLVSVVDYTPSNRCSTMSASAGAGFYAAALGPFPYSWGQINPQRYYVFEVTKSLEDAAKNPAALSPIGAIREQYFKERQALAQQRQVKPGLN